MIYDNQLRPAVEIYGAWLLLMLAGSVWLWPTLWMMPLVVAQPTAVLLAVGAGVRAWQGGKVLRYRRQMRRLPTYKLADSEIPLSQRKLFLGRGFAWTAEHTQRVFNSRDPRVLKYIRPGQMYDAVRRWELQWERYWVLRGLAKLTACDHPINPVRPLPPLGGNPVLHAVEPRETDVWLDQIARGGHTAVYGTTGVGKTRLAELMVTQDIRRGDGAVIFFDPKGDEALARRMYAEAQRAGRAGEFYYFDLGFPDRCARYNPVGNFSRITEVASRIAAQLPNQGNSVAFREFAWRFTNSIARALVALGRRPDYFMLMRYVTNIEPLFIEYTEWWLNQAGPKDWKTQVQRLEGTLTDKNVPHALKSRGYHAIALTRYLRDNDVYDPVADSLRSAVEYDRTFFDKLVASLLPFLEKLTSGPTAQLLAPDYFDTDDARPIFSWQQVIRRRAIVYVGLRSLTDADVASAVGNSMFADLTSVAGQIYTHGINYGLPEQKDSAPPPLVYLHADEFNEIAGDEFVPMLNKARGAGFRVTVYTQTSDDIEARFGSRAKAGQVAGNLNNLIMLRVKNINTARVLTDQLPKVRVKHLLGVSGATDVNDAGSGSEFVSRNEDKTVESEIEMVQAADLVQLPIGQAYAHIEGGKLYKLRLPLLAEVKKPATIESLLDQWYAHGR